MAEDRAMTYVTEPDIPELARDVGKKGEQIMFYRDARPPKLLRALFEDFAFRRDEDL